MFQLLLPKTTCAVPLTSGAVRKIAKPSPAIAVESASVRFAPLPAAPLAHVVLGGAGMTIIKFEPKLSINSCICLEAPFPIATIIITAPTPIIIPSIVRIERVRLLRSERIAVLKISMNITRPLRVVDAAQVRQKARRY